MSTHHGSWFPDSLKGTSIQAPQIRSIQLPVGATIISCLSQQQSLAIHHSAHAAHPPLRFGCSLHPQGEPNIRDWTLSCFQRVLKGKGIPFNHSNNKVSNNKHRPSHTSGILPRANHCQYRHMWCHRASMAKCHIQQPKGLHHRLIKLLLPLLLFLLRWHPCQVQLYSQYHQEWFMTIPESTHLLRYHNRWMLPSPILVLSRQLPQLPQLPQSFVHAWQRSHCWCPIGKEVKEEFMISPCDNPPFPVLCISPLGVATQKYSGKRRLNNILVLPIRLTHSEHHQRQS